MKKVEKWLSRWILTLRWISCPIGSLTKSPLTSETNFSTAFWNLAKTSKALYGRKAWNKTLHHSNFSKMQPITTLKRKKPWPTIWNDFLYILIFLTNTKHVFHASLNKNIWAQDLEYPLDEKAAGSLTSSLVLCHGNQWYNNSYFLLWGCHWGWSFFLRVGLLEGCLFLV